MLNFISPLSLQRGELSKIIYQCYESLINDKSGLWKEEKKKFDNFDKLTFNYPDTIGKCVFVTKQDNEIVGLASWDPRNGEIGQNCILPKFRGRGYGKMQLNEILNRLKLAGFKKAIVTTSGHPFFKPALVMYEKMGFAISNKKSGGPDQKYGLIDLEKTL